MKNLIITHHGWSGNKTYFENFFKDFSKDNFDFFHIDAGYFYMDAPFKFEILKNYSNIIGIGHSIGFVKLLSMYEKIKFNKLISIAGFAKFCNNDLDLKKLHITINAFQDNPIQFLKNFYKINHIKEFSKNLDQVNFCKLLDDLTLLDKINLNQILQKKKNNINFYHLYNKNDQILGNKKSINKQINSDFINEFSFEGDNHSSDDNNFIAKVFDIINE